MDRALAIVAVVILGACGNHPGAADGGNGGPTCVPKDGVYTCLGGTWPACSSGTNAIPFPPCDLRAPSCMGCDKLSPSDVAGVGYTCTCEDAGLVPQQDAALWGCIGTGFTCQ